VSWRGVLGLTIVLVGLAAPAMAAQEGGRSSRSERRDEAFRMVDAYIIANIQESLELTDEQYEQAIPLVNKLQKARRQFFSDRYHAERRLRRLLGSGTATEAEVIEALENLKAVDVEGPANLRAHAEALDAVLSPLQQAKYRVFEADVEQRLRRLMRRARGEGKKDGDRE
jgi:hypothetical protein